MASGELLSITHKNSIHKKTVYDKSYHILEAYFTDGAIYQFLDVPLSIFRDIQQLEENKTKYDTTEDNDIVSDFFYSKLWETLTLKGRVPNRYAIRKMQYFYVKLKGGTESHGRADQKTFNDSYIVDEIIWH